MRGSALALVRSGVVCRQYELAVCELRPIVLRHGAMLGLGNDPDIGVAMMVFAPIGGERSIDKLPTELVVGRRLSLL